MDAEARGRPTVALGLFIAAWEQRVDDHEAAVAAHYLARHQDTEEQALLWNQRALDHAERAGDGLAAGLYPSLYLNLARSYERIGEIDRASHLYRQAERVGADLADGGYARFIRGGVARGLQRCAPRQAC